MMLTLTVTAASTTTSATNITQTCHFMRLPPELRLQIYQSVFDDLLIDHSETMRMCKVRRIHQHGRGSARHVLAKGVLAVLHINHVSRVEAATASVYSMDACAKSSEAIYEELDLQIASSRGLAGTMEGWNERSAVCHRRSIMHCQILTITILHGFLLHTEQIIMEGRR